ncbi:uncharacterized protein DS421_9g277630 [Arachis hypogaea]|nr:uncharacterized protein DS421_9g277630 [Arachis hypogaea]
MRLRKGFRLRPPQNLQQRNSRELRQPQPVELPLHRPRKRWTRPECCRSCWNRAGGSPSGVVLDRPIRVGNNLPQEDAPPQVQGNGTRIGYGILHPLLRWTRGWEVPMVQHINSKGSRSSL